MHRGSLPGKNDNKGEAKTLDPYGKESKSVLASPSLLFSPGPQELERRHDALLGELRARPRHRARGRDGDAEPTTEADDA